MTKPADSSPSEYRPPGPAPVFVRILFVSSAAFGLLFFFSIRLVPALALWESQLEVLFLAVAGAGFLALMLWNAIFQKPSFVAFNLFVTGSGMVYLLLAMLLGK
jgi:hypothetical protein